MKLKTPLKRSVREVLNLVREQEKRQCSEVSPDHHFLVNHHELFELDPLCPICKQEAETVIYLVWDNYSAKNDVWANANLQTHKWPRLLEDFNQLWDKISWVKLILKVQQS